MIDIIPFRAIRPPRDKAALVATRSYISYTDEERADKLNNNPYSFLRIIHPPGSEKLDGVKKFKFVREEFDRFLALGYLKKDEIPKFYVYRQRFQGASFSGIIAGISTVDYREGRIKKHEHTITRREKMFKDYLGTTKINAEPVLLTYDKQEVIEELLVRCQTERPEYEFTTTDEHTHELWLVEEQSDIALIKTAFSKLDSVYIADGHHRSASSALLAEELRKKNPGAEKRPFDYFSAYLISDAQMEIKPFHRLVKTLNRRNVDEFLAELTDSFTVEKLGSERYEPDEPHHTGMYLNNEWYKLKPHRRLINTDHPVEQLDSQILSTLIFNPILGIKDEKTDKNVAFYPAVNGLDKPVDEVNQGKFKALFTLPPVTVDQLKKVADNGLTMPPKSTWVEPKLRSGLTIYDIDEL